MESDADEERNRDSGYPRANRERERLLARAASRGSICIPLSRGYRSQTPREITREEIFGIEWAIMRLHLNNLRGVDWAQAGAGVEIERSRGALGFAVADRCRSSFDRLLRGFGRIRVATLVRLERRSRLSLGLDSRRDKAHLGALMSFSSGGRPVRCSTHVKEDEATSAL